MSRKYYNEDKIASFPQEQRDAVKVDHNTTIEDWMFHTMHDGSITIIGTPHYNNELVIRTSAIMFIEHDEHGVPVSVTTLNSVYKLGTQYVPSASESGLTLKDKG